MIDNQPRKRHNIPPILAAAMAPDPLPEADRARLAELQAEEARARAAHDQAAGAMTMGASCAQMESRASGPIAGYHAPLSEQERADRALADAFNVAVSELQAALIAVSSFHREIQDRERAEAERLYKLTYQLGPGETR